MCDSKDINMIHDMTALTSLDDIEMDLLQNIIGDITEAGFVSAHNHTEDAAANKIHDEQQPEQKNENCELSADSPLLFESLIQSQINDMVDEEFICKRKNITV